MPGPIPIHGIRRGAIFSGSAFLVAEGTNVWLVTCAHVISGRDKTPPLTTYFEDGRIKVLGPVVEIPLYQDGEKRFEIVVNNTYGTVVDALSVRLNAGEASFLREFGAYDLSSIVPVETDEQVTMTGFPGMKSERIEASTLHAKVLETSGANFKISKPSAQGYSGGPVVTDKGLVGVATGDVGHETALTNGLAASLAILKSHLFQ